MEPRIQYAQTADGVSIAFYTLGDGMPVARQDSIRIWSVDTLSRLGQPSRLIA